MHFHRSFLFGAAGIVVSSLTLGIGGTPAWASGQGGSHSANSGRPPGNNGTVKIDEYSMDPGQDNDPHVTCDFSVNFFGYDSGSQSASITITPVAPTPGSGTYQATTSWNVGTRTSGNQFDQTFQVSQSAISSALVGVTPQPQQGYHLRLEVEVTGSKGSDDKYKVFWLAPCATSPTGDTTTTTTTKSTKDSITTTTAPATTTTVESDTTTGGTTSGGSGTSSTAARSTTLVTGAVAAGRSSATTPPAVADSAAAIGLQAAAGGRSLSRAVPVAGAGTTPGRLAFTGSDIAGLSAAGFGLIAAGGLLTVRWRRRPAA
jgi:hypothetical protein